MGPGGTGFGATVAYYHGRSGVLGLIERRVERRHEGDPISMSQFQYLRFVAMLFVLAFAGGLACGRDLNKTRQAGTADWRGLVPLEALGPVPESLMAGLRLMRQGQSQRALPLIAEFHQGNPRDLRGIRAYVEVNERLGRGSMIHRSFRARGIAEKATLAERFAYCASGAVLESDRDAVTPPDLLMATEQLIGQAHENVLVGIVVSDVKGFFHQFASARLIMDGVVRDQQRVPELRLLRAVLYGRGTYLAATTIRKDPRLTEQRDKPRYGDALRFLAELREDFPEWALPLYHQGVVFALENRQELARASFEKYLSLRPDPMSKEGRIAKQYLERPTYDSLWLAEELEQVSRGGGMPRP